MDTNVYRYWAEGKDLAFLQRLVRDRTPVFASPSTILELLEDYWTCAIENRLARRRALVILTALGGQRILPPSATVALRKAGTPHRPYSWNLRPRMLRKFLSYAIRRGRRPQRIVRGSARIFNREGFLEQLTQFRERPLSGLRLLREELVRRFGAPGSLFLSSAENRVFRKYLATDDWWRTYVTNYLKQMGVTAPSDGLIERLRSVLEAAFVFDTAVLDATIISNYNPSRHRGDVIDSNQLAHLADERLAFVTADQVLHDRVRATLQGRRVLGPSRWRR